MPSLVHVVFSTIHTCARDSSAGDCGGDQTPPQTASAWLPCISAMLGVRTSFAACCGRPRARSHARVNTFEYYIPHSSKLPLNLRIKHHPASKASSLTQLTSYYI